MTRGEQERGRAIAQRLYPELGTCERGLCLEPAVDRHHKDRDVFNNDRSNIEFLCRRCHKLTHGQKIASNYTPQRLPPKPCVNCHRPSKPLRNGRCHTCDRYHTKTGMERPYTSDGRKSKRVDRSLPCSRCGKPLGHCRATPVKGLCGSCFTVLSKAPTARLSAERPVRTHCSKGHPLIRLNDGQLRCRACHAEYARTHKIWAPKQERTRCRAGHLLEGENVYRPPSAPGSKVCKTCERERQAKARKNTPPIQFCKRGHPLDKANTRIVPACKYRPSMQRQCRACDAERHRDTRRIRKDAARQLLKQTGKLEEFAASSEGAASVVDATGQTVAEAALSGGEGENGNHAAN